MSRRSVIGVVVFLIALPGLLAALEAVSFHVHNRANGFLVSSGEKREYILHVPANYNRSRPMPLVISFHGAGGWAAQQMDVSRWNELADHEGFIVVYPSGVAAGGPGIWRVWPGPELNRDVGFITELIDKLEFDYAIDRRRIYANGLSNGGGMSFALSCMMSDRIAAVGLVAAAQTLPFSWCDDRRPVPMIAFHGTADPVVPYNGGVTWLSSGSFPNVPIWTAKWARRNGCNAAPVDSHIAADVTRREYSKCTDNAAVVLYTLRGGGHSWPGGGPLPEWLVGPTSRSIDATKEMWRFFLAHPLAQ